jgi:DNA-directed RNA polymerase alpha subunit
MEAAWRRKAAYADKDTLIFLMISEEYDVKSVQQWIFSPVTDVRYLEAAINTEQTRGNDKAKADAARRDPQK